MKPKKLLQTACCVAIALLWMGCSQDETTQTDEALPEGKYPLVLNVGGLQTSIEISTRTPNEDTWEGVEYVAVSDDGGTTVKKYKVTPSADYTTATLTCEDDPFMWTSETKTIIAWYPFTEEADGTIKRPTSWTVSAKQTNETFASEDLITMNNTMSFASRNSTTYFYHILSKNTVNLIETDFLKEQKAAGVSVSVYFSGDQFYRTGQMDTSWNFSNRTDLADIYFRETDPTDGSSYTFEALMIPQPIGPQSQRHIVINVGEKTYRYTLSTSDINLLGNHLISYRENIFNLTVDYDYVTMTGVTSSASWTSDGNSYGGGYTVVE